MNSRDQHDRIEALFEGDDPAWLLILDAGRYDVLWNLIDDHLRGALDPVNNGGHTATTAWFNAHFPDEYDLAFFSAGLPMRRMDPSYDEFEHFGYVETASGTGGRMSPRELNQAVQAYSNDTVAERLNDLGYAAPETPDSGVIRYMDPHRPYPAEGDDLPELSQEGGDARERTQDLIDEWQVGPGDIYRAYADTYREALKAALSLSDQLEGDVAITADHGEMLGEIVDGDGEQLWYHGHDYPEHPALIEVPWLDLSEGTDE